MKVVSVPLGRCGWIIKEMNPSGRSLLDAFQGVANRYRFSEYPKHLLDWGPSKGLVFKAGTFIKDDVDWRVGLTVFNDGLMADSLSSTDNSEAFLEDLRQFVAKEFNLPIPDDAIIRKTYVSQLHVHTPVNLVRIDPIFDKVATTLSQQYLSPDGNPRQFGIGGLKLWPEDVGKPGAPLPFVIERKWESPFNDNLYFCQAPLRTQEHITILEDLEKKFSS